MKDECDYHFGKRNTKFASKKNLLLIAQVLLAYRLITIKRYFSTNGGK